MSNGGGTLKTLFRGEFQGKRQWLETVIDLDRILYVSAYPNSDFPGTCLAQYNDDFALHLDVTLAQMRKIMDEHKIDPLKNFDTHSDFSD